MKYLYLVFLVSFFYGCNPASPEESSWNYRMIFQEYEFTGEMRLKKEGNQLTGYLLSYETGKHQLNNLVITANALQCGFQIDGTNYKLNGVLSGNTFSGSLAYDNKTATMTAIKVLDPEVEYVRPGVDYILTEAEVGPIESDINHQELVSNFDFEGFIRGERIYNSNCVNCHGNPEVEGSIPMSHKFWSQKFNAGYDPFSLYQTITRGFKSMPPQLTLTPQEKYDVILYIRENFIRKNNPTQYLQVTPNYVKNLPYGSSKGPDIKPYHPWSDMDYGNFFINTYELSDSINGIPRYHSPRPTPYKDEDYSKNNFAYKGIAIRLDQGKGGVSEGKAWVIFDHDLMRIAGGWTGKGFIDWNGILLNDQHETYPRTIGRLHFETPVQAGFANPQTGKFEDNRFKARDGRKFGPLPKSWANYKGLYHYENKVILSYSVGNAEFLEMPSIEYFNDKPVFIRTLNIGATTHELKIMVAGAQAYVNVKGTNAEILKSKEGTIVSLKPSGPRRIKIFISGQETNETKNFIDESAAPEDLKRFTTAGNAHYPEKIKTSISPGNESNALAVDKLSPPYDNPWKSRMKLSGIDFMKDPNIAVICTTDGDVWKVEGITQSSGTITWQRIASGLFQPLGIKVLDEKIYVTCRDQLVRLQDLNGDGETDFYESFNHDHQVTDHFHEFAMGLQSDQEGNLYYAKSGRHAREALIPQHGTLLKVSKDGSKTDIIAKGFRAANGVCINPDGSFIVTDQQGYWNPMNRINWISGTGNFYGNMWGYDPPKDSSASGMEPPLLWLDMDFDRSPSELLWVDSENWGPLNGKLLSLSYGYGKVQLVLTESVQGKKQGGIIDLPEIKFLTGIMRGRFNPSDGQLYACGLSAWGTSQVMKGGDLYRLRYTGKPLSVPTELHILKDGVALTFAQELNPKDAVDTSNYQIETWSLKRSRKYGSDRLNRSNLKIEKIFTGSDHQSVCIKISGIKPTDVMTIRYKVRDINNITLEGKVQNTIHALGGRKAANDNPLSKN
jgi:hypothetical protein